MELMKKTVDEPYLGKMQSNKMSSPYASNKRKVKIKFPWKKNEGQQGYETSDELDSFIQEVIDRARKEYQREYESEKKEDMENGSINDTKDETTESYMENKMSRISDQSITDGSKTTNQEQLSRNTADECSGKNRQGHEKKPLLSAKNSLENQQTTAPTRALFRRMMIYMTCCYCRCFRDSCDVT